MSFPPTVSRPSTWTDFARRYAKAKVFPCQQVVRALTRDYFACFSFSKGLKSFTGYLEPLRGYAEGNGNLIVPYRRYNTGNIIGWYETSRQGDDGTKIRMKPDALLLGEPQITLSGNGFTVRAQLLENDSSLLRSFTLRATAKGLSYKDKVKVLRRVTIDGDKTGMLAVGNDPFTGMWRKDDYQPFVGKEKVTVKSLLDVKAHGGAARIGEASTDHSITTLKLYPYGGKASRKHDIKYLAK